MVIANDDLNVCESLICSCHLEAQKGETQMVSRRASLTPCMNNVPTSTLRRDDRQVVRHGAHGAIFWYIVLPEPHGDHYSEDPRTGDEIVRSSASDGWYPDQTDCEKGHDLNEEDERWLREKVRSFQHWRFDLDGIYGL
jgi:hypothetical protein